MGYAAKAIGSAEKSVDQILIDHYNKDMSLADVEKLALNCLKQAMEKKIAKNLVYLTVIPATTCQQEIKNEEYIEGLLGVLPEIN